MSNPNSPMNVGKFALPVVPWRCACADASDSRVDGSQSGLAGPSTPVPLSFMGTVVPPVPGGLPADVMADFDERYGVRAAELRGLKSELLAGVSRMGRDPYNNREALYGLLPIRAETKQWSQRRRAEQQRASHSTYNPAIGEKLRPVCCLRCARHLAEWQGPEEGAPPVCIEVGGKSSKCGRCGSEASQKHCLPVTGVPGAKLKVLLDVVPRTLSDDDLVSIPCCPTACS